MRTRLTGIVLTLWFILAVLSLFVALAFSPLGIRLLLPGSQPGTWIYPLFLTVPPVFLFSQHWLGDEASQITLWSFALALGAFVLVLLAFVGNLFFGAA
ncbi:MAG: hypothetical protein H0W92_03230 [Sphingomonas sp.]|nr:hypothetical protein [Sphingomonas sp.]